MTTTTTAPTDGQVAAAGRRQRDALAQLEALIGEAEGMAATIRTELGTEDDGGR